MKLNNIKMVAFDVGDTIHQFSNPKLLTNCYNKEMEILRKNGIKFKTQDYYFATEKAWRESQKKKYEKDYLAVPKLVLKYLGCPENLELVTKMGDSFVKLSKKHELKKKKMVPGAINIIKYLHKKGYKLGIISDTKSGWIRDWIKYHNFDTYFYIIILSFEINGKKASQKPFLEFKRIAKSKYKIKPSEIMMIGDLSVDMDAKKHGFKTTLLDPINQKTEHFLYTPDIKIKKLKEIKNYL